MVIGESLDIDFFEKLKEYLTNNKDLDDTYDGPDFYWYFHQLGKLGEIKLSLIRWEIWYSWKDKKNEIPLNSSYIGSGCGLFIYNPSELDSWDSIKDQINAFFSKQKKEVPVCLVIALYNPSIVKKEQLLAQENVKKQVEFVKSKKSDILFVPTSLASDVQKLFDGFCSYFIKKLDKKLASEFDLNKEMKWLNLYRLRYLLIAEKQRWDQSRLDEYLKPKEVVGEEEVWELPEQKKKTRTRATTLYCSS